MRYLKFFRKKKRGLQIHSNKNRKGPENFVCFTNLVNTSGKKEIVSVGNINKKYFILKIHS